MSKSNFIQVDFNIPIPIDNPSGNGYKFSKDAVEKALKTSKNIAILDVNKRPIGATKSVEIKEENGEYYLVVNGLLWGTRIEPAFEIRRNSRRVENSIVIYDDFDFAGFNLNIDIQSWKEIT